ncbi:hypothetical protein ACFW35_15190 [Fictibacillus sp. NPDC058756]|uniref:hypothetical protein n=1 Tax=Fictibacillus sp. NPDC058756 TaxID=3346625 RepID=UPI0036A616FF
MLWGYFILDIMLYLFFVFPVLSLLLGLIGGLLNVASWKTALAGAMIFAGFYIYWSSSLTPEGDLGGAAAFLIIDVLIIYGVNRFVRVIKSFFRS